MLPTPLFETLTPLLERALGDAKPRCEELAGGMSPRRFFRLQAGNGQRALAMYVPPSSPELTRVQGSGRPWPFLEVRELLEGIGIRVPALLAKDCAHGWLLVEDLGDTLAQHLEHSPADKPQLYQRAVRDLAHAQRALRELPEHSIVRQRAFDLDLLLWEIEHFREWALEARGIALGAAQRAVFAEASRYLATTIAAWPRGFVHRDYQSRNLMVVPNATGEPALAWIDFQDAMLGPRVYDLVALLGDSYQSFDGAFIEARLAEFSAELGLDAAAEAQLVREFHLVSVQRKLKDAGRFVYIHRHNGNPSFLRFVEPAIEQVRRSLIALEAEPALRGLSELLADLFPMPLANGASSAVN